MQAPVPKNCTLDLKTDLAVINENTPKVTYEDSSYNSFLLKILLPQHENIHSIHGLYPAGSDQSQVIVVEQLQEKGSLRDKLYGVSMNNAWRTGGQLVLWLNQSDSFLPQPVVNP